MIRALLFLRLAAACLLAAAAGGAAAQPGAATNAVTTIERAERVIADTPRYPDTPEASTTATVSLPDDGADIDGDHLETRWYRLRLPAPPADATTPQALYIARLCGRPLIDFNGERLLGAAGGDTTPGGCQDDLLMNLPARLWHPFDNHVDLRLSGLPRPFVADVHRAAGLAAPQVGPYALLEGQRGRESFHHTALPRMIGAAMLMLGLLTVVVGWLNTRKTYLFWFSLVSIGWGVLTAGPTLQAAMPSQRVELLLASLAPLIAAAAVLFLMRYAGMQSRQVESALFAQCIVVPASLALAGAERLFALSGSWYVLLVAEVAIAAAAALRVAWRVRKQEFWVMLALLGVMAVTLLSDLAGQYGLATRQAAWWQLGLPIGLTIIGLRLVYLEVAALRAAEGATRGVMERRAAEAMAEAERKFAQQADLRVEQVTERERKRIAADLHDDLGAKLLTIVHTSESDRISTLAREALEEMRLSVRGLTGKPVRLSDALGDWRAEVVSRLGQANIGANWQSPVDDLPQTLPARSYVQTTRILREAVSNIIKHSGASRCSVSGAIRDADFVLTIRDNGKGIPMELDGKLDRGHGMTSMKQRAKGLQGQCLVESGPGFGTVIRLTVPL